MFITARNERENSPPNSQSIYVWRFFFLSLLSHAFRYRRAIPRPAVLN